MGKLEDVMKSEIARLAKREIRPLVEPLQRQLRQLARQVKGLTADVQRLGRQADKAATPAAPARLSTAGADASGTRLSPGLIKKIRKRTSVTQHQLAALVGVSAAAVQSWEQGIARPTGGNRTALIALRQLSPPEVAELLADKGVAAARRKPRTSVAAKADTPVAKPKAVKKVGRPKKATAVKKAGRPKKAKQ